MEYLVDKFLYLAFLLYFASAFSFVWTILLKNAARKQRWERISIGIVLLGLFSQLIFIILRTIVSGHFPTSNMYEFVTFLCFATVLAFTTIFFIYRTPVLGVFVMFIVVILLAFAGVFPRDVQPLIPALQSHWLFIHVTTAALAQGGFAVSFVAGLILLLHQLGDKKGKQLWWLETVLVTILIFVAFSILSSAFAIYGHDVVIAKNVTGQVMEQHFNLPPITGATDGEISASRSFFGWAKPIIHVDGQSAIKWNSFIWALVSGIFLYVCYRLITKKLLVQLLHPVVNKLDQELVDEISYRAIAIAYPLFTLGALIFAMIWAHEAWGRFWGWDPKETWAFITWLFYSIYLHLRLSRGWFGTKSAWLAVGGFIIIMINLLVINFVISGLHSYA